MYVRRTMLSVLFAAFVAVAVSPVQALADHDGQGPTAFIEGLADEAVKALTDKDTTREERIVRFRSLLNHNFNVPLIGKWVLGRHWRSANPAEKAEYMSLFEDLIVITYVEYFDQYSGEALKVVKTITDPGKDSVIYTHLMRPSGDAIRVDWRVRQDNESFKIIDVYVEGSSMGQTQRSQFASLIRKNGGKLEGLIKELRSKVAELL
ncbi:MAG: ABC transporter substrate-binding protein [Rhodospirillaceae bacterium]|nr:ABC transporter substrate-binding protein [Rhodospirillaceae bacterium]